MGCTSTTTREWHCRGCGCLLANDHADDLFCSPCQRGRAGYNPRHDGRLGADLLDQLQAHRGRPVAVYLALGLDSADVTHRQCLQEQLRRLRRAGHEIAGRGGLLTWHGWTCSHSAPDAQAASGEDERTPSKVAGERGE